MRNESGVQDSKGKYRKGKVAGQGWSWGEGRGWPLGPGNGFDFMERQEVGKGLHLQSGTEQGGTGGGVSQFP